MAGLLFAQSTPDGTKPAITVRGYITAIHLPASFDVNGEHVDLRPDTSYGLIQGNASDNALNNALCVGAFVEVSGKRVKSAKTTIADRVSFRDGTDKKLSGMGLIESNYSARLTRHECVNGLLGRM